MAELTSNPEEFLWVTKYRPKTVDECILPQSIKDTFNSFIKSGQIPTMLLCGTAGTGKTTLARALCNQIDADMLFINASEENGIDTLRTKVKQFASTVSFGGGLKVVIMDEADNLNASSTQPAFRGMIEEFSKNCRFILTCNFRNRIIDPLQSRCTVVEFKIPNSEKKTIIVAFYHRVIKILDAEGIKYDQKAVALLIQKHFPDFRRVLNELQRYSAGGVIDEGLLTSMDEKSMNDLFTILSEKNFKGLRLWVGSQVDLDSATLFRQVFDKALVKMDPPSVPQLVLILADYQYKEAFVADKELNVLAALTEIMANCKVTA